MPDTGCVVSVGALPTAFVVNESTEPYVEVLVEFTATAWK
jgi:hypothetical protein